MQLPLTSSHFLPPLKSLYFLRNMVSGQPPLPDLSQVELPERVRGRGRAAPGQLTFLCGLISAWPCVGLGTQTRLGLLRAYLSPGHRLFDNVSKEPENSVTRNFAVGVFLSQHYGHLIPIFCFFCPNYYDFLWATGPFPTPQAQVHLLDSEFGSGI